MPTVSARNSFSRKELPPEQHIAFGSFFSVQSNFYTCARGPSARRVTLVTKGIAALRGPATNPATEFLNDVRDTSRMALLECGHRGFRIGSFLAETTVVCRCRAGSIREKRRSNADCRLSRDGGSCWQKTPCPNWPVPARNYKAATKFRPTRLDAMPRRFGSAARDRPSSRSRPLPAACSWHLRSCRRTGP